MNNLKKKIVAVVTTVTIAAWMLPGSAFALTADELQAQINALLAQLSALQVQLSTLQGGTTPTVSGCTISSFTANLKQGDSSDAVKCLQVVLNSSADTQVAASGVGSPGNETMYFGPLTKTAVIKFQEKYASEVLATYGLTSGTGFVGSTTRAKLNTLLGAGGVVTPTPTPTPTQTPVSTTATVSLAADTPAAKQIALGAVNAIATKIKFTGGTADYTVSQVVIKRGGVSADADISAIKLYDGTKQLGSSQALNTNTHKATFSNLGWVIPAGETKYLIVKVSIAAKGVSTVGDGIQLNIEAAGDITSTATLTGTFPIAGNALTIAGTSVGELFVATSTSPAAATVLSGATDQEIAGFTFEASSTEAVDVYSITITHVGSASAGDIANIKLKYAGAQIGSTVAALDSQNQATFDLSASPLNLLASQTKTVYAYADIAAGIWTDRTVIFEITQFGDVTAYGTNSGGAIEASHNDTQAYQKSTGNTMTIGQGSLTVNVDAAYNPASQNYVKGTSNRLISAYKFTAGSREGVRVVKFRLKLSNGSGSATDISNITLWDGTTKVAGPVSLIGSYATFGSNTIGWDDPGLFDVAKSGNKTIQVKADIPTGAAANNTVDLDIDSYSDIWIDGLDSQYDITQNTTNIVLTSGNGNLHTITASGALTVALSANTPSAQTVIKGASAIEMMRINLTADSGEDLTVSSLEVNLNNGAAASSPTNAASGDYTNVKLLKLDGTQLGSTVASPTTNASFSFNLTVPASETVTLKVVADIPSATALSTGSVQVTDNTKLTTQGVSSSATITETATSVFGKTMTFGQGSLTVSAASVPGDQNIIIGTDEIPVVGLVFTAGSAEDVRVTRIKLTGSQGGGTPSTTEFQANFSNFALYDGATRLTSEKGWDSTSATTVTFSASDFLDSQGITITKGGQKTITVKADFLSTGNALDVVAMGIASSSDLDSGMGGLIGTRDVTFTGLSSNTTPTTTLSATIGGALTAINFTTTTNSSINYVTLQSSGTMIVSSASDTPDSAIVTVGTTGGIKSDVVFTKVNFTAAREDMDVQTIIVERKYGNGVSADTDFVNVSLWDGTTQLGSDQSLVNYGLPNSSTTFNFPSGSYWRIPKDVTKTLTIKADLHGVKSADQSGATTGNTPALCYATSTIKGASSGATVAPSGTTDAGKLCGNWQVVHKSKPTIASASLPSTTFAAGEKTLYRWTVTAGSDGAIGWSKVIFDVSGSVQIGSDTYTIGAGGATTTFGIYMGTTTTPGDSGSINAVAALLISSSTLKVYDVATGDQILGTTTDFKMDAGISVYNYYNGGARVLFIPKTEQVVSAGATKTYELRGDILYGGKAGDSISTKIAKRATTTSTDDFFGLASFATSTDTVSPNAYSYVTSTASTFVWSDRSGAGATHSFATNDWSQEYKVATFPTATLSLSK